MTRGGCLAARVAKGFHDRSAKHFQEKQRGRSNGNFCKVPGILTRFSTEPKTKPSEFSLRGFWKICKKCGNRGVISLETCLPYLAVFSSAICHFPFASNIIKYLPPIFQLSQRIQYSFFSKTKTRGHVCR